MISQAPVTYPRAYLKDAGPHPSSIQYLQAKFVAILTMRDACCCRDFSTHILWGRVENQFRQRACEPRLLLPRQQS